MASSSVAQRGSMRRSSSVPERTELDQLIAFEKYVEQPKEMRGSLDQAEARGKIPAPRSQGSDGGVNDCGEGPSNLFDSQEKSTSRRRVQTKDDLREFVDLLKLPKPFNEMRRKKIAENRRDLALQMEESGTGPLISVGNFVASVFNNGLDLVAGTARVSLQALDTVTDYLPGLRNTKKSMVQFVAIAHETYVLPTTEVAAEVAEHYIDKVMHWSVPSLKKRALQRILDTAPSYEEWKDAAEQLDRLEGNDKWKTSLDGAHFDAGLIATRLQELREARLQGDVKRMMHLLRCGLFRNLGGMLNPELHERCRIGTKKVIEDYIDEVVLQLDMIANCDESAFTNQELIDFFYYTRQSFGRTAFCLSGGGGWGTFHFGHLTGLVELGIVPRVLSGSSVGSLVAAIFCCKTDYELLEYGDPDPEQWIFLESANSNPLMDLTWRFLKTGYIFDHQRLQEGMRSHLGDITFQEAYNRTRRILNISINSTKEFESPRLLNHLTAPDVLVWSAVAASCAIPYAFAPIDLMAKTKSGEVVPWSMDKGNTWSDGSFQADLPMNRMAELFNVNHFIVFQINPHVIPVLKFARMFDSLFPNVLSLISAEYRHRFSQLYNLGVFPKFIKLYHDLLDQKYDGDITIMPDVGPGDYSWAGRNPSDWWMKTAGSRGRRSMYSKASVMKTHLAIELALDENLYHVRLRELNRLAGKSSSSS
eukprot:Clim_evm33s144 gene=Clim_evmTU33s144